MKIENEFTEVRQTTEPVPRTISSGKQGSVNLGTQLSALKRMEQYKKKIQKNKKKLKNQEQTHQELQKLTSALEPESSNATVESSTLETLTDIEKQQVQQRIIWQPDPDNKPQIAFLEASEEEVLYSGSRGSGKTDALIADPLRYVTNGNFKALIIRKSMKRLREIMSRARKIYLQAVPGAKWKEQEKIFVFPSGATIEFGYCDNEADLDQYIGQEYVWLGIDELTQYPTDTIIETLKQSLRSTDPTLTRQVRCCIDEGSALTTEGWKDIKDVKVNDYVYSLTEDGELVKKRVYAVSSFDVNEKLVRIKKRNLYVSMTNDHRVVYKSYTSNKFKIARWNTLKQKNIDLARTCSSYNTKGYSGYTFNKMNSEDFISFLGLYLAEGSINTKVKNSNYKIIITQLKQENLAPIKVLLDKVGLRYNYSKNGDFQFNSKEFHAYLKQFGKAKTKFVPRDILNTSNKTQLSLLLHWLMFGDGHWQTKTSGTYYTTSKQLADDVLEISLKLGYKVQVNKTLSNNPNHADKYTVYLSKNSLTTRIEKNRGDEKFEDYTGKVYCISVEDTENFVVNQRGYVHITGNTCNPGGAGHRWVKERFVNLGLANTTIRIEFNVDGVVRTVTRKWIHSTTSDNTVLIRNDPNYLVSLHSIQNETLKRQWVYGDWDAAEGAAFTEFDRKKHVVKPFQIPSGWMKFRACDWGYSSLAVCLWFAIDYDNNIYIYRELVENGEKAAKKLNAPEFARKVLSVEAGERVRYGVLDASCWSDRGQSGPSIAEEMIMNGCIWRQSDSGKGSRIAGKMQIHNYLKIDEHTGRPKLFIFDVCKELIDELASLPLDENNPEDVDTDAVDHAYDTCRYGLMSRPQIASDYMWRTDNGSNGTNAKIVVSDSFGY